jgi:hypothetical protein
VQLDLEQVLRRPFEAAAFIRHVIPGRARHLAKVCHLEQTRNLRHPMICRKIEAPSRRRLRSHQAEEKLLFIVFGKRQTIAPNLLVKRLSISAVSRIRPHSDSKSEVLSRFGLGLCKVARHVCV